MIGTTMIGPPVIGLEALATLVVTATLVIVAAGVAGSRLRAPSALAHVVADVVAHDAAAVLAAAEPTPAAPPPDAVPAVLRRRSATRWKPMLPAGIAEITIAYLRDNKCTGYILPSELDEVIRLLMARHGIVPLRPELMRSALLEIGQGVTYARRRLLDDPTLLSLARDMGLKGDSARAWVYHVPEAPRAGRSTPVADRGDAAAPPAQPQMRARATRSKDRGQTGAPRGPGSGPATDSAKGTQDQMVMTVAEDRRLAA